MGGLSGRAHSHIGFGGAGRKGLTVLFGAFLVSCQHFSLFNDCSPDKYTDYAYEHDMHVVYPLNFSKRTPQGVWVDTSRATIDLPRIDEIVNQLSNCLGVSISKCALRVKIAPDWNQEPDGRQWFPCREHKCYGQIQYPAIVVTTPNLASLRHELIHNVTHATDGSAVFKKCDKEFVIGSLFPPD